MVRVGRGEQHLSHLAEDPRLGLDDILRIEAKSMSFHLAHRTSLGIFVSVSFGFVLFF